MADPNSNNGGNRNQSDWVSKGTQGTADIINTVSKNWYNPSFLLTVALPIISLAFIFITAWNIIMGLFGAKEPIGILGRDTGDWGYYLGSKMNNTLRNKSVRFVIEDRNSRDERAPRNITYDDLNRTTNSIGSDDNRTLSINARE